MDDAVAQPRAGQLQRRAQARIRRSAGARGAHTTTSTVLPSRALRSTASIVAARSRLACAARSIAGRSCSRTTFAKASAAKRKPLPAGLRNISQGTSLPGPRRTRSALGW